MIRLRGAFLFVTPLLSFFSTCAFAWGLENASDQMTDKKIVALSQPSTDKHSLLFIKCWEDDTVPEIAILTDIPFDPALPYSTSADGKIRFDKENAIDITYSPREVGGRVVLDVDISDIDKRQKIFDELDKVAEAIKVQLGTIVVAYSAKGIKPTRDKFFETCFVKPH